MTTRRFMAAGLTAALLVTLTGSASAGWWEKAADATPVDLQKVMSSPEAYKGKEITFDCVFHEVSKFFNPYYTRFTPAEYVNFSAWPASSKLWREADYMGSHPFLFVERGNGDLNKILATKKYARLRLTGYVQNTFKNQAWIEVRFVEVLSGGLTSSSLREIVLGDEAAEKGRYDDALAHFESALGQPLSSDVVADLELKRGKSYLALGQREAASAALARGLSVDPDNEGIQDMMAEMSGKRAPRAEEAPAIAKPVDPTRYEEAPKAIPAPVEKPVEKTAPAEDVEPVKEPVAAPEDDASTEPEAAPETPEITTPEGSADETPAETDEPAEENPLPGIEKPTEKPEGPGAEPDKEPVPEKRMSGPM